MAKTEGSVQGRLVVVPMQDIEISNKCCRELQIYQKGSEQIEKAKLGGSYVSSHKRIHRKASEFSSILMFLTQNFHARNKVDLLNPRSLLIAFL